MARKCKAYLLVTKSSEDTKRPTNEPKQLTWTNSTLSQETDIGARIGAELLHVVFSDSQFEYLGNIDGIYAMVSVLHNLPSKKLIDRPQDGFGIGDFEAELSIIAEDGTCAKSTFAIHVSQNFRELSMRKLS